MLFRLEIRGVKVPKRSEEFHFIKDNEPSLLNNKLRNETRKFTQSRALLPEPSPFL